MNIAIFLQLGVNLSLLPDMTTCLANVASVVFSRDSLDSVKQPLGLDLYVSVLQEDARKVGSIKDFYQSILPTSSNIYITSTPNVGADIGAFLAQLKQMNQHKGNDKSEYDLYLKLHTKTDPIWQERMLESLCGTVEQVESILDMNGHGDWGRGQPIMVGAMGTMFGPTTPLNKIFPHISNKYQWTDARPAFDDDTIKQMNEIKHKLEGNSEDFTHDQISIAAGTWFWINHEGLKPYLWAKQSLGLSAGYIENGGIEHAIERVFPSMVLSNGGSLFDIQPAPRPIALYFPQYHRVPENDIFWGKGFTEWTLLRNLTIEATDDEALPLKKPLPFRESGLGYYNLEDFHIRKRQAELARQFGVTGLCIYHYWFSGDHAPENHLVMGKIPEAMLRDGQPNVPFMLSWANEPWSRRWTGEDTEILLSQDYDEGDWIEHYEYLVPFWKNPSYIRVNNAPVFAIYRPGHAGEKMQALVDCWQKLAQERGDFPDGLHFVQTVGNFYQADGTEETSAFGGSFQFWPQLFAAFHEENMIYRKRNRAAAFRDAPLENIRKQDSHYQYWGAFVGFDRHPRDKSAAPILVTPPEFRASFCASLRDLLTYRDRHIATNLYFITAWNEWNEQAVLEPNQEDHFGYLQALQYCISHIPVMMINLHTFPI